MPKVTYKKIAEPNHIFPETEYEIMITCPRCDSNRILVQMNQEGYYEVKECHECGYRKILK